MGFKIGGSHSQVRHTGVACVICFSLIGSGCNFTKTEVSILNPSLIESSSGSSTQSTTQSSTSTKNPTQSPTPTQTQNPTQNQNPTSTPTPTPTQTLTSTPTQTPTSTPTQAPTPTPTHSSSTTPTLPAGNKWVQVWSAPPAQLSDSFNNQTIRYAVRASVGGSQVRVRLTNVLNTSPIQIGEVHAALSTNINDNVIPAISSGSTDPSTDQRVTFSGSTSVTINPGQYIYSDPVQITVPALGFITVSIYYPGSTGLLPTHSLGKITPYLENGNQTGSANISTGSNSQTISVLDGIDVNSPSNTRVVVAIGDSITDGAGATADAYHRWPDYLSDNLNSDYSNNSISAPVAVSNAGISGNAVLTDSSQAGPSTIDRFQSDVLSRSGVTDVIVLEGINDLLGYGADSSEVINGYQSLIATAHAAGLKVFFGTLTPLLAQNESVSSAEQAIETQREQINAWIRTTTLHDGYFDMEAAVSIPGTSPPLWNPNDPIPDNLHPNDPGNSAMAQAVQLNKL